jgi:UDP-N-acetylmuramoyl-tripeptide--D-alanyl-D-alanine ligase
LQLLKLEPEHEVAVIEMGMNHAGEIAALAKIAEPNWAVVSNVAPVHMEFFPDGLAGIARAKYELVEALPADGLAVLNFDDGYVKEFGRGMGGRAVFYGVGEGAEVRAVHVSEIGAEGVVFTVETKGERASVQLKMLGRHNVGNALAAIAVGLRSGMSLEECAAAVGELRAGDKRGEVLEWRGAMLINDCYNSNPKALDAMVDALMAMPAERHVVIAGEMLELGNEATALHAACGQRMAECGVSVVVGVRGVAESLVKAALEGGVEAVFVSDAEAAGEWMQKNVRVGDAVLLKASRGVRLERALAGLTAEPVRANRS